MNRWHAHPVRDLTPDEMIVEALTSQRYWSAALLLVGIAVILLIVVLTMGGPMQ